MLEHARVEVTALSAGYAEALAPLRRGQAGHDPGRVATDVAVMLQR
ncbi:hypothetical protein ACIBPB_27240 [Micromonospora sp. NPDC049836]